MKDGSNSKEQRRIERLHKRCQKYPPDGNVFSVIGKYGWRQRGWLEHAYPGIGRGAILPTDWVGLGCTLLSKRALSLASFEGYSGQGTQDLFLCWNKWFPANIRMAVITHVLADHVKPIRDESGKKLEGYELYAASHQPDGEFVGHLRVDRKPWYGV